MAAGCRFAAASSWRCRRSGPAASALRSGSRPATPSLPAGLPPRWAADFICAAPISASWSVRRRGCDRGRVRRAAGRRVLRLRAGDRRIYAGQPDAGRRRRGGGLFRHPWIYRRCRSASASARSAMYSGAISSSPRCSASLAALFGIGIMRGVALCEALLAKIGLWPPLRPALGGLGVGLLALLTPQVMSSGHGALHFVGLVSMPLQAIAGIFVLKAIASVISLGSRLSRRIVFRHFASGRARRPAVRCRL